MAIAFDASSEGTTDAATSHTLSHTCTGSNRLLLVHLHTNNTTDIITGVTYGGVAMTQLKSQVSTTPNLLYGYVYGLVAPATGANDIVASFSSESLIGIQAISYTGVSQTGLPDASNSNNSNSTSWTETITSIADNCWHFLAKRTGDISSVGTGGVRRLSTNFAGRQTTFDSNGAITPAGAHSITGTYPSIGTCFGINITFAPYTAPASAIKTINGLAVGSVKTFNGLAVGSIKSVNGLQ